MNGLTKLEENNFHMNHINELDACIFNGLINLKAVYFADNQISDLFHTNYFFNDLKHLKEIYLVYHQLKNLYPIIFNNLISLEELHFWNHQITKLD